MSELQIVQKWQENETGKQSFVDDLRTAISTMYYWRNLSPFVRLIDDNTGEILIDICLGDVDFVNNDIQNFIYTEFGKFSNERETFVKM